MKGKATLVACDVSESLEQLHFGLLARFYANKSLWKTRRFNIYVFHPFAYFGEYYEHAFTAGGL